MVYRDGERRIEGQRPMRRPKPKADGLAKEVKRAVAEERERCAKIAEEFMAADKDAPVFRGRTVGYAIAVAIRKSG